VYPRTFAESDRHPEEVRIAFDGDAVLFDDQAERVYRDGGIAPGAPEACFIDAVFAYRATFGFGRA
jgi:hypothetical protein